MKHLLHASVFLALSINPAYADEPLARVVLPHHAQSPESAYLVLATRIIADDNHGYTLKLADFDREENKSLEDGIVQSSFELSTGRANRGGIPQKVAADPAFDYHLFEIAPGDYALSRAEVRNGDNADVYCFNEETFVFTATRGRLTYVGGLAFEASAPSSAENTGDENPKLALHDPVSNGAGVQQFVAAYYPQFAEIYQARAERLAKKPNKNWRRKERCG
jgi:hypothetical protein